MRRRAMVRREVDPPTIPVILLLFRGLALGVIVGRALDRLREMFWRLCALHSHSVTEDKAGYAVDARVFCRIGIPLDSLFIVVSRKTPAHPVGIEPALARCLDQHL